MPDCTESRIQFGRLGHRVIEAGFDGGELSSDGGLMLLRRVDQQFEAQGFLPSSPFLSALAYIRERREGLEVYLNDSDVAIDTNHLERALRVIPMGRRNWLFAWTELGAKHIGMCAEFARHLPTA